MPSYRRYGLMAASTSEGSVTVYKRVEAGRDGDVGMDLARCWELQPAFQARPMVFHLTSL
jgi:hypothetical protein